MEGAQTPSPLTFKSSGKGREDRVLLLKDGENFEQVHLQKKRKDCFALAKPKHVKSLAMKMCYKAIFIHLHILYGLDLKLLLSNNFGGHISGRRLD